MATRYELSDDAWAVFAELFSESRGRGRLNDRLKFDGMLGCNARLLPGEKCRVALVHGYNRGYNAEALCRYFDQYRM